MDHLASEIAQKMMKELRFYLGAGFTLGLIFRELEELMTMSAVYLGFPTAVEGFRILREISGDGSVS